MMMLMMLVMVVAMLMLMLMGMKATMDMLGEYGDFFRSFML